MDRFALKSLLCTACVFVAFGESGRLDAQIIADASQQTGGITVYGTGESLAKPDMVEIGMRATASAELTADAIVKYRDAKRRTLEAFDNLKLKELEVEELGLSLSNENAEAMQAMMRGMGMAAGAGGKTQVQISSSLQLRLSGIGEMKAEEVMELIGKLLDAARDSGAVIGPSAADMNMAWRYGRQPENTVVRFVVRDLDKLREAAYEDAVADARARAQRLAKLNGIKLGTVMGVQEIQVSGDDTSVVMQPWEMQASRPQKKQAQISSESFAAIPFRVKLLVRFSIDPLDDKTARN